MSGYKRNSAQRDRLRAKLKAKQAACGICGQVIDYGLPSDDPMSFQLDHILPLSKGGQDIEANAQASHRTCNSTKRARVVAPIVRRSRSLDW